LDTTVDRYLTIRRSLGYQLLATGRGCTISPPTSTLAARRR